MNAPINAAASADIDGRYAWLRLVVSVVLSAVGGVGTWAVIVVLPAVQAEFGTDRGQASLAYTATMLGFAAGNALGGRAIDRFGFVRPALGAALMLGAGFLLAAHARSIEQFTLVQGLLIGIGSAATFGPLIADISHWFVRRRGIAVAIAAAGNYLAGAVWPATMPPFILSYGWRVDLYHDRTVLPGEHGPDGAMPAAAPGACGRDLGRRAWARAYRSTSLPAGCSCSGGRRHRLLHRHVDAAGPYRRLLHGSGLRRGRGAEMLSLMLPAESSAGSPPASSPTGSAASSTAADRLDAAMRRAAALSCRSTAGLALYRVARVRAVAGRHRPLLCHHRARVHAARRGRQRVGIVIMATVIGMALGGWMSGWIYDLTGSYQLAFLNGIAFNLVNMSILSFLYWRARPALPVAGGAAAAG